MGDAFVVVHRSVTAAASRCRAWALEHGLSGRGVHALWHVGSFQTRACPLHWQADSSPLDHQESPLQSVLMSTVSIVGRGPGTRNE